MHTFCYELHRCNGYGIFKTSELNINHMHTPFRYVAMETKVNKMLQYQIPIPNTLTCKGKEVN